MPKKSNRRDNAKTARQSLRQCLSEPFNIEYSEELCRLLPDGLKKLWLFVHYAIYPKDPALRKLLRQWWETFKYFFVIPAQSHKFTIVSTGRNTGTDATRSLASVYNQNYDRGLVRHIVISDNPTDNTGEIIESWMRQHPDNRVNLIRNKKRLGGCHNNLRGFNMAVEDSIVIELNMDDWLAEKNVLRFLNKVYQNNKIWMTYNTFMRIKDGKEDVSKKRSLPGNVIDKNTIRQYHWETSHLHSFRRKLIDHLDLNYMINPDTGEYWENSDDQALYLTLAELCGRHSRNVERILYMYNVTDNSDMVGNLDRLEELAIKIRKMKPASPLKKL